MYGPRLAACDAIHAQKYRQEGETFEAAMRRIAKGLTEGEPLRDQRDFEEILLDMRFMPAGRIQAAVGAERETTPYNCFVGGTVADSFVEGEGNIMQRVTETAATMRMGGGVGTDFSTLRPRNAPIKKLKSKSTGPISFMSIWNGVGDCTASVGDRRGAQMGVLRIDHPDIREFIKVKQNISALNRFNISVGVTDEFMECLAAGRPFELRHGGQVYDTVDPAELWEEIMLSTWDWAEPGVLFIDTINRMNNLWYCETIAATNPCAEQPLPPHGACLLGSFNLTRYVSDTGFNWFGFSRDIPLVVRAMDRVVDVAIYPLPAQEREAKSKRRMGIGVTGLANAVESILGRPSYGDHEFVTVSTQILEMLKMEAYHASVSMAMDRGAFPLFDANEYTGGEFITSLGGELRADIKRHGIRNSHLLSIAPTGTISMCADNVSSSIEPVFEHVTVRPVHTADGVKVMELPDYGHANMGISGRTTDEVTIDQHVDVLLAASRNVDSAVSKTCNVPGTMSFDDFKKVYLRAYEGGAKGCTTFRKDGKRLALLTGKVEKPKEEEGGACYIGEDGKRTCD